MPNPREYPDELVSAESGRPMKRGAKKMTIEVDGFRLSYEQPGWWCSIENPNDNEGQLTDEDNLVRIAARREARARAKNAELTPLQIRAIREMYGLSQKAASEFFGGGPKSFEKYESGEVSPSSGMVLVLLLAAEHPEFFEKRRASERVSEEDAKLIRKVVRKSSIEPLWERIYEAQH